MSERSIDLAEAQRLITQAGGRVFFAETPEERLEGKWLAFVRLAREIEEELSNGVRLARRPRATVMPSNCNMVRRVLQKLEETTPVVVPEALTTPLNDPGF